MRYTYVGGVFDFICDWNMYDTLIEENMRRLGDYEQKAEEHAMRSKEQGQQSKQTEVKQEVGAEEGVRLRAQVSFMAFIALGFLPSRGMFLGSQR